MNEKQKLCYRQNPNKERLLRSGPGQAVIYKCCPQGLILISFLCNFRQTPIKLVMAAVNCHEVRLNYHYINYKQIS